MKESIGLWALGVGAAVAIVRVISRKAAPLKSAQVVVREKRETHRAGYRGVWAGGFAFSPRNDRYYIRFEADDRRWFEFEVDADTYAASRKRMKGSLTWQDSWFGLRFVSFEPEGKEA